MERESLFPNSTHSSTAERNQAFREILGVLRGKGSLRALSKGVPKTHPEPSQQDVLSPSTEQPASSLYLFHRLPGYKEASSSPVSSSTPSHGALQCMHVKFGYLLAQRGKIGKAFFFRRKASLAQISDPRFWMSRSIWDTPRALPADRGGYFYSQILLSNPAQAHSGAKESTARGYATPVTS